MWGRRAAGGITIVMTTSLALYLRTFEFEEKLFKLSYYLLSNHNDTGSGVVVVRRPSQSERLEHLENGLT